MITYERRVVVSFNEVQQSMSMKKKTKETIKKPLQDVLIHEQGKHRTTECIMYEAKPQKETPRIPSRR